MDTQSQQGLIQSGMSQDDVPDDDSPEKQPNENRLRIILAAMKVLYSQGTSDGIVRMLQAPNTHPAQSLAQAVLFLLKALFDESNGSMPPQEIAPAASQILQLTAELGRAAGAQIDDQAVAQADQVVQQSLAKRFGQAEQPEAPVEEPEEPVEEPEAPVEEEV